jgi:hypothetical protein
MVIIQKNIRKKIICNSMQCNIFHEISSVTTEVNLIQMNSKRRYLLFWNSKQQ